MSLDAFGCAHATHELNLRIGPSGPDGPFVIILHLTCADCGQLGRFSGTQRDDTLSGPASADNGATLVLPFSCEWAQGQVVN